jgi:hypothetical protein
MLSVSVIAIAVPLPNIPQPRKVILVDVEDVNTTNISDVEGVERDLIIPIEAEPIREQVPVLEPINEPSTEQEQAIEEVLNEEEASTTSEPNYNYDLVILVIAAVCAIAILASGSRFMQKKKPVLANLTV